MVVAPAPASDFCAARPELTTACCRHADGDRLSRRLAAYEVLRFVYERFSADEIKHEILGPSGGEAVSRAF